MLISPHRHTERSFFNTKNKIGNTNVDILTYNSKNKKYRGDRDIQNKITQRFLQPDMELFSFSGIDINSKRYLIFNSISKENGNSTIYKFTSPNSDFSQAQIDFLNVFNDNDLRKTFLSNNLFFDSQIVSQLKSLSKISKFNFNQNSVHNALGASSNPCCFNLEEDEIINPIKAFDDINLSTPHYDTFMYMMGKI